MAIVDDAATAVALALGHDFRRSRLLIQALTHRSYTNERRGGRAAGDNESLEFLGDAVLGWVASTMLWDRFEGATAGELTRRRADLVREESLASLARDLGIGSALRLGRGEERSGGRDKPRLLASAFEACIAAIYLDGGPASARRTLQTLLAERIGDGSPGARDYKTRVQELVQRRGGPTPRYETIETLGPDHQREFRVALSVGARRLAEGHGRSKLEAEQGAASQALGLLEAELRLLPGEPEA
ncbi:MAG: ribonuclease III [Proteobacteria bacterium]|nr:ribonuclease III [Pseudomonadota bacterium]